MFMTGTMDNNVVSQHYYEQKLVLVMLWFNMMSCKKRITTWVNS